ncbi:MAG TPA: hypothetical protein VFO79_04230 [Xanthomonadales bacterium]|nr:hypothetical protein [Xanthomonadales bacterium]
MTDPTQEPSDPTTDPENPPGDPADQVVDDPTEPTYPTAHPRIYLGAHRTRLTATLNAGTPAASKLRAKVDQWLGGADIWGFQAWNAALIGQLTGDAKYCTKAVATVEAQVAAAESSIAAGSNPVVAGDSYLEIGEMIGDLALVYDWCFDRVTASQRSRWIAYANQAVWNVWNHTQAKWGSRTVPWSGWSVNNPSNNYYYSFLRATMLLGLATKGENPQADAWITKFRGEKIMGQLVPTFESDLVGGASREGTGYGVAMRRLFELYDWWKATTGESLATKTQHTRASMFAFIHQTMPTLDKVAPTGDHARDSTAAFFDYHRDYAQQLMMLFPTTNFARRAKTMLAESSIPAMSSSFMLAYDFLADNPDMTPMPMSGLNTAYHAKGIGEIYARSGWDKSATWVNLIAGPYTESHAHQDQGSIMIYKGGWLAHDANIHSRSGLSQETTSHGLVRINSGGAPVKQVASTISTVTALHQGADYLHVSADLTPAYKGHSAVQKVQREMIYVKPDVIIVYDRVASAAGTTQTWQLQAPTAPSISGTRATISNAGHTLAVHRILGGTLTSYDQRADSDLTGGYRLDETVSGGDNRYLHVLGVDGAVTSATANGENGVTIALANGQTISATFQRDTVGATLVRGGQTITLGAGVDVLPE